MLKFIQPNIERMAREGDIKGLGDALWYRKSDEIRLKAICAFGDMKEECAVGALIQVCESPQSSEEIRRTALQNIGKIGGEEALLYVISRLKSNDPLRGDAATWMLGTGDPHAQAQVEDAAVQGWDRTLLEILEQHGWIPGASEAGAVSFILQNDWDRVGEIGKPAVEPLMRFITGRPLNEHDLNLVSAVGALGKIGDGRASEALAPILEDSAWQGNDGMNLKVRLAAARALGRLKGGPRAIRALSLAVSNRKEDIEVRTAAAESLGSYHSKKAAPALLAALSEPAGLAVSGSLKTQAVMVERFRNAVVAALGQTGDPSADAALKRELAGSQNAAASQALLQTGWQPDDSEAGAEYYIANGQYEKCVKIGAAAVRPLVRGMRDIFSSVSITPGGFERLMSAAQALQDLGWKPGNDDTDAIFWIASLSFENCVQIGTPAVGPLVELLRITSQHEYADLRRPALEALRKIAWKPAAQVGILPAEQLLDCIVEKFNLIPKTSDVIELMLDSLMLSASVNKRGEMAAYLVGSSSAGLDDQRIRHVTDELEWLATKTSDSGGPDHEVEPSYSEEYEAYLKKIEYQVQSLKFEAVRLLRKIRQGKQRN